MVFLSFQRKPLLLLVLLLVLSRGRSGAGERERVGEAEFGRAMLLSCADSRRIAESKVVENCRAFKGSIETDAVMQCGWWSG